MNILNISKITGKLNAIRVLFILAFVLFAAEYIAIAGIQSDLTARTSGLSEFMFLTLEASGEVKEVRRNGMDFLDNGQSRYRHAHSDAMQGLAKRLEAMRAAAPDEAARETVGRIANWTQRYGEAFEQASGARAQENAGAALARFSADARTSLSKTDPLFAELVQAAKASTSGEEARARTRISYITIATGAVLILLGLVLWVWLSRLSRGLRDSFRRLSLAVGKATGGDYTARTGLDTSDELGELGRAFDQMLDERVANLALAEMENEQLNDSIVNLMEAVAELSTRDLTVTAPVAEDVTGPVADAVNLMASQTAKVLAEIAQIAHEVERSASTVRQQSDKVTEVAEEERRVVNETTERLQEASQAMNEVAAMAKACNEIAARANESTQKALDTVSDTATGMNDIRATISETEKRIKRLGERSQEINGVVAIINNIAERTHVLAVNASMQAAAAGEAGRGFAVVADEVQRLAESSRQSTSEIAALVNNIQSETSDTMATMNKTITQVIDGAALANLAGEQMLTTQQTTAGLAVEVDGIAKQSLKQAEVSRQLLDQASKIQAGTEDTAQQLDNQTQQTNLLVELAKRLVTSVSVFKLPG